MITWMTKREAAEHMRVSTKTIDRLVRDGKLTKFPVAGSSRAVRFRRDDLDKLLLAA
jgi:excisionase family DNA binding protein